MAEFGDNLGKPRAAEISSWDRSTDSQF